MALARPACLAALLATAFPAQGRELVTFPAAQCAAFWLGRDDYARRSAFLDREPSDRTRAAAFRAAAVRLNGGDAAAVDAFIAGERGNMALTFERFVLGDRTAEDVHDILLDACEGFAPTAPETRGLP